jgi:cysteinyl-tRNA synthetase
MGRNDDLTPKLIETLLDIRQQAKQNKDWATSDRIRDSLTAMGIRIKDTKEGAEWEIE